MELRFSTIEGARFFAEMLCEEYFFDDPTRVELDPKQNMVYITHGSLFPERFKDVLRAIHKTIRRFEKEESLTR